MKYTVFGLLFMLVTAKALATPLPVEVSAAYNTGQYLQAELMLLDVLATKPSANAHYRLGEVYTQTGRHKQALVEFRTAIMTDPMLTFVKDREKFNELISSERIAAIREVDEAHTRRLIAIHDTAERMQRERNSIDRHYNVTWIMLILLTMIVLFGLHLYARYKDSHDSDSA